MSRKVHPVMFADFYYLKKVYLFLFFSFDNLVRSGLRIQSQQLFLDLTEALASFSRLREDLWRGLLSV